MTTVVSNIRQRIQERAANARAQYRDLVRKAATSLKEKEAITVTEQLAKLAGDLGMSADDVANDVEMLAREAQLIEIEATQPAAIRRHQAADAQHTATLQRIQAEQAQHQVDMQSAIDEMHKALAVLQQVSAAQGEMAALRRTLVERGLADPESQDAK